MLYVLTSSAGALLAWATTPTGLPTAPASSVLLQLDEWDAPPPLPYQWSASHRNWIIPPPPAPPRLTAGDFARRVGMPRMSFLHSLKYREDIDATTKGEIDTLTAWLQLVVATGVSVDDPVAIDGAHSIGALLEALAPSLIPEGRAAYVASLLVRP